MNSRVNYPVKQCLVQMEEYGEFDIENLVHKYCISWLTYTIRVTQVGTSLVVQSWKSHHIPGQTSDEY